jgi:hypothetical protein
MSFFSKFAAPLIAAGGDLLGGFLGASSAKSRQEDAQDFSADQFARRYQITTADMKAAGLNPMLAYSQGGGNAPTSSAASASSFGSPGTAAIQAQLAQAQLSNAQASARKTNAEAAVIENTGVAQGEANLQQTLAQIGLTAAQNNKVIQETENLVSQLQNIKDENLKIRRAAEMLFQQGNLYFQQGLTEAQRYQLVKSQANYIVAQTGLTNLELQAAKESGNFGREFGQYKGVLDVLIDAADLLGRGRSRTIIHKKGN